MKKHLCLLRGINVAGHRKIKMTELVNLFEELGFSEVSNYLQSGNILFKTTGVPASLASKIQRKLQATYKLDVSVLVFEEQSFVQLAENNPLLGRKDIDPQYLHLTLLFEKPNKSLDENKLPVTGDEMAVLANSHYYLYCPNGYGRTKINNSYFERSLKVVATTRNWKTVQALKERLVN